jgi:N-sulfoglucosamine sulfohydrolase
MFRPSGNFTFLLAISLYGLLHCNMTGEVGHQQNGARTPLNILILTVDDLTYNSIGAFGCKVPGITPNIDQLSAEGIRFTRAFTNTAVCQPSRQTLQTGRFPHNHGGEGLEPIHDDVPTLSEQLHKAGYINGILGKETHHQPTEKFFWDFIPFISTTDSTWRKSDSRNHTLFYEYSGRFLDMAKKSGRPFFFVANSHDPHRPFVGTVQDSILVEKKHHSLGKKFSPSEIYVPAFLPDLPDIRKEVAQYYGSVNRADKNIGAVLQALKESGLADNTLIIFLSDHGASLPFGKSQCYLNSNKTPFILKWPGQVKGGSIDSTHFISAIDVMPTILELLSLPNVPDMDGKSFLPVLQGKRQKERKHVFTTYYQTFAKTRYPMRCIQSERYGYIYNFWSDGKLKMTGDATGGLTWNAMLKAEKSDPSIAARVELYRHRMPEEFYDFSNDPDGLHNLINDPAYAKEIDRLRDVMLKMMKQYRDPAFVVYRDRHIPGVVEQFMEDQRKKALKTVPNKAL